MGGGDLNLKKSWHPLLFKNQERVWQEEKKAIDERKRTQQLLKEQAEERQIQELQRMGGKREERVDWLYNAPAAGTGQNTEEMEAYLLGKKSVEQLFNDQDRKRMEALKASAAQPGPAAASGSATGFQAIGQNTNSVRDLASKIRDDPLLAIKKQEQKAYEELMKNPARLKELREAREAASGKTPKERKHKEHRSKHRSKHDEEDDRRSRRDRERDEDERPSRRRRDGDDDRGEDRKRRRSASPDRSSHRRRERSRSPRRHSAHRPIPQPTSASIPDAAARLAAMTASASQMHKDRAARLTEAAVVDRAAEEREAAERQGKMVKGGGRIEPAFLKAQQDQFLNAKLEARG